VVWRLTRSWLTSGWNRGTVPENRSTTKCRILGLDHSERETRGGCDATLGIGFLYCGADRSSARLLRDCTRRGWDCEDSLLYLPGSISCIAGWPPPSPNVRWRHSGAFNQRKTAEQLSARNFGDAMSGRTILGIALVVIGLFALAYQGVSYTTQKKVVDIGPIQATKEEHHTITPSLFLQFLGLWRCSVASLLWCPTGVEIRARIG
jgi:hypothetical protein